MNKLKKFWSVIGIILTFFIIYFLQANFFSWFTISGVKPNLFVIFILFIGLFAGRKLGIIFGLFFGIYIDLLIGKTIGFSGIVYAFIGWLGEYFDKNFSKDSKLTIMLMVAGSTIIFEATTYILNIIKLSGQFEIITFVVKLIIEVFYNIILTIILYPLLQKTGYYIEDAFKNKKILTRYF